jgi:rhomboid family GlyGly-CTERM serine protease
MTPGPAATTTPTDTRRSPVNTLPLLTVSIIVAMLAVEFLAPEPSHAFQLLVLDRAVPRPWPWLTAHFLHTDWAHVGWNALAFAILGWLGEPLGRGRFALSIGVGIVAVDIWFAWLEPHLRFYCGLSGALNTVLLASLYALRNSVPRRALIAVAVLVAGKVAWEAVTGTALLTHTRWPAAVGAHVAGYCAGALLVLVLAWRDRVPRRCDKDRGIAPTA